MLKLRALSVQSFPAKPRQASPPEGQSKLDPSSCQMAVVGVVMTWLSGVPCNVRTS